ncbi:hypothetical protein FEF65_06250 [Mariprofundus erugo]|uniref:CheW-like domain-containing protein n=2 Tax=Mariprofundus erugo TaxID=2528639 RepID=A0A5R9GTB9_9PROT|nr:hypothetical protein FEF65_06250 [Mariprofundus erugo]
MMNAYTDKSAGGGLSCLLFTLNGLDFAVDVATVREIVWLPKLTPVEEVPHYVVGVLNLRGVIAPVIDLNLRFGRVSTGYRVEHQVIVLEYASHLVGIIVDDVSDVVDIPAADIADTPMAEQKKRHPSSYICAEIKLAERIVMLLSATAVCALELDHDVIADADEGMAEVPLSPHRRFCPAATDEEMEVFRGRARELMVSPAGENGVNEKMVAVISIGKELFGIELDLIREFTEIGHVVPIPCVPRHIVGDMNLKGEILTLVDIRGLIGVPDRSGVRAEKLIVVAMDGQIIGILIDEVRDLIRISGDLAGHAGNDNYLKCTIAYDSQMLGILDLEQVIRAPELVVDEMV